jgi:hypothetical protein
MVNDDQTTAQGAPAKSNKKAPIGGPLKKSLQTIKQPI